MPRYFFSISDDGTVEPEDDAGHECVSDTAARVLALRTLTAIAADRAPRGANEHDLSIEVHDAAGKGVYEATLIYQGRMLRG